MASHTESVRADARPIVTIASSAVDNHTPPVVAIAPHVSSIDANGMPFVAIRAYGGGSVDARANVFVYGLSRDNQSPTQWQPHLIFEGVAYLGTQFGQSGRAPGASDRLVDRFELVAGDGLIRQASGGHQATLFVPTDGAERILVALDLATMTAVGWTVQLTSAPHTL